MYLYWLLLNVPHIYKLTESEIHMLADNCNRKHVVSVEKSLTKHIYSSVSSCIPELF